jgi:hypothetical protein
MKRVVFLSVLFFITIHIYCNDNDSNEGLFIFVEPDIIFSEQIFGNINLGLLFFLEPTDEFYIFHGSVIGFETNFISSDYIYGIKAGYCFETYGLFFADFLGLTFRLYSIFYHNNVNQWDIRIQPEIGLSFVSIFGVTYGYNFTLSKTVNKEIGNHRVTIFFRIPLSHYYNGRWNHFFRNHK